MFGFLYEMLGGQHDTIGRRRAAPSVAWDHEQAAFVASDGPDQVDPWPGRGQMPGPAREPTAPTSGQTVVEEMRELLAKAPSRE